MFLLLSHTTQDKAIQGTNAHEAPGGFVFGCELHTVLTRVSLLHSLLQPRPPFFLPGISFKNNFTVESNSFPQRNMQEAETLQ